MKKLKYLLRLLQTIPVNPKALLKAIDEDSLRQIDNKNNYGITRLPTIDLLDLFPDFDVEVNHYCYLGGGSFPTDLALLKKLAQVHGNCSYLEIGSWRGESVMNLTEVAKDCTAFTLSPEDMTALGFPNRIVMQNFNVMKQKPDNLNIVYGNSETFDFHSLGKKFDLIFVDGDHRYAGVKNDTKKVFELLKDENSIIVWHDYSYWFDDVRGEVLAGILDGLPASEHKNLYHVSNTLCAIYTKKKFEKTSYLTELETPTKTFSVRLRASKL